jgi:hypothetical protein
LSVQRKKTPVSGTPIRVHLYVQLEIAELLVAQQQPTVAGARRVLFANEQAVLDEPVAAGAMPDAFGRFVPSLE